MLLSEGIEKFKGHLEHLDYSPSTIERYIRDLNTFKSWIENLLNGQVYLEDISDDDIEKFITSS